MRIIAFSCLLIVNLLFVKAQQVISLYPDSIPGSDCKTDMEVWSENKSDVRNVTHPTLTLFFPNNPVPDQAAVIVCPGGGYSHLSIGDGGIGAAKELAKNGIVGIVLKYRTAGNNCIADFSNIPLQDVQQAIYQTRLHAREWNIDRSKTGLMGFSAGGHLAAMAATHFASPLIDAKGISLRPDFTILAYSVISFTDTLTSKSSKTRLNLLGNHPSDKQKLWFSAEKNILATTPPAYIIHASDDSIALVGNSIAYYDALTHFKIASKMLIYQKGGHAFALHNKMENDYWLPMVIKWLRLNKMR
ncbi:MAG: alpha/beta hydrolase [Paludibacter sp.]|nr:alpha/beta hydrolase [Paludibacter sp.]